MPNWTTNIITVSHKDKSLIDAIEATGSNDQGILQTIIPCPEELNDNDLTTWSHGPEQEAREKKQAALMEKYGYKSWYDWNIAHWGTKWDLCEPDVTRVDDNTVTISCQTAWSPPTQAFETMQEQGYEVRALYVGEGMEYAGIWDNGQDHYYGNFKDSRDAKVRLPRELDDAFDIVDTIIEYELENEEDLTRWVKEGAEANAKAALDVHPDEG